MDNTSGSSKGGGSPRVIALDPSDNVAVVLRAINGGEEIVLGKLVLIAREAIAAGHKLALRAVPAGERVFKYGEPIGVASVDIAAGEHVHVHNLSSARLPDPRQ